MIIIAQILLLCFLAFVPVWVGGQAMKCYDQGFLMRSVYCVALASILNMGVLYLIFQAGRYNWSVVTLLSAIG